MIPAASKRRANIIVEMSPEQWVLAGQPEEMNVKWYDGTGAPKYNTDSKYSKAGENYRWHIETGKFSKGGAFCLEAVYYSSSVSNHDNKHYRANIDDKQPMCDSSSNDPYKSKYFTFMSLNLPPTDPNHPSSWYYEDNYN